jgi:hypothetical protein
MEEQASIHNEADWVPAYFHAKSEQWKALMRPQRSRDCMAMKHMHHSRCIHGRNYLSVQRRPYLRSHPPALKDFKTA